MDAALSLDGSESQSSGFALQVTNSIAKFQEDGYVVIDSGISEEILDRAAADVDPVLRREPRIQDAWKKSRAVHRIATWPLILDLLRQIYQRKPLPFQTLNFRMGTEQDIHSDTVHFNSLPSGYMCGAWVALEDIDEENGPLVFYPGSHKWPEVTLREVERDGYFKRGLLDFTLTTAMRLGVPPHQQGPHYKAYERYMADLVQKSGVAPRYGVIKKGQVLFWASNLLHGGSFQKDKSRTRKSQVTHYFFEGHRYYTPLHSHGSFICYRNPQWLPELA